MIAIIAVLIGILLPALGASRDASRKVVCRSNLRSVHQMFHVFATDRDGAVPIGYRGGRYQWNTMVYSGTSSKYVLYGRLYLEGLMDSPSVFYCPAETAAEQAFDTPINPWPPGSPGVNVQGGYAMAPLSDSGFAELPPVMPRLDALGFRGILSDGVGLPDRLDSRHRTGVNVLHADSGVTWVERSRIASDLDACTGISPAFNPQQGAIWAELDKR